MAKKNAFKAIPIILGAGAAAWAAYQYILRPWHLRWGASDEEASRSLPGDELLPEAKLTATHAITIQAPPERVWPWLAQLGQGRGGFYSYEWIENLMGADIHNAGRILPQYQNPKVGDQVPLAKGGFGIPIAILEPGRTMVLHGDTRVSKAPEGMDLKPGDYMAVTWGFHLEEQPDRTTRLVERFRLDWNPSPMNSVYFRLFLEPGAFVMEHKMLREIKALAERWAS